MQSGSENGNNVILYKFWGGDNQLFQVVDFNDMDFNNQDEAGAGCRFMLASKANGKVLEFDFLQDDDDDNGQAIVWERTGGNYQYLCVTPK